MSPLGKGLLRARGRRSLEFLGVMAFFSALAVLGAGVTWAQNLAWNGDFDTDVSGWEPHAGGSLLWTDLDDESACPGSGMALSTSVEVSTLYVASIEQCVGDLTPNSSLAVSARHLGYGSFTIELAFWGTIDCESGYVTGLGSPFEPQDPVIWSTATLATTVPAAAHSVVVRLAATDFEPHGLGIDGVVVAKRLGLLLDGFEADDPGSTQPCRWNAVP